ncbi:MAG: GGDEF domain-containing protein, partial [Myxococcales bacterium]
LRSPVSESRPWLVFVLTLVAIAAIGWVDVLTGPEFGMSLFLAVPVFIAADRAGPRFGAMAAAAGVGAWVAASVMAAPVLPRMSLIAWNASVRAGLFAALVALSHMRQRLRIEQASASTDALTGIANRRALNEVFARERSRVLRSKRPLTLAYLDCDNFKAINDRFGHATGNDLLRTVASVLASSVRSVDLVARIGGDEFAILLVEAEARPAREILERIRMALRSAVAKRGWPVTFSIGAVTTAEPPDTCDEALQQSDLLMYRAKRNGKDRLVHDVPVVPSERTT